MACEGGRTAGGYTVAVSHIALRIVGYTGFPKNKVVAASVDLDALPDDPDVDVWAYAQRRVARSATR